MKEVHQWESVKNKISLLGLTYQLFSECVDVYEGITLLGRFRDVEQVYYYLLGYESGLISCGKCIGEA